MRKLIYKFLRWLSFPLVCLAACELNKQLVETFWEIKNPDSLINGITHPYIIALLGFPAARYILAKLMFSRSSSNPLYFIDTLEHELTHALFGFLSFSPPESLSASAFADGEVRFKRQNLLMVLSPYFFPLWTLIWIAIGWVVHEDFKFLWNTLSFGLLGLYVYRLGLELRWYQTDLKVYGFFFSLAVIFCLLPLVAGLILYSTSALPLNWIPMAFIDFWANLKNLTGWILTGLNN